MDGGALARSAPRVASPAVVVKLGGSIISHKATEFSYRDDVVVGLGRAIAAAGQRVVLVHGGGAFGHPLAKRYHLSSSTVSPTSDGVSETRRAMFELDMRVCASLLSGGLRPYTFAPFPLLAAAGRRRGAAWLDGLLAAGLTPLTFGDVVQDGEGFRIVSGDTISRELSRTLHASRCVFVMDVDGILDARGRVIRELGADDDDGSEAGLRRVGSAGGKGGGGPSGADATGGIATKVREGRRIASQGTEVAFVSGFRRAEVIKSLKGLSFHGTIIKGSLS